MKCSSGAPGVQDAGTGDARSEALRIFGQGEEGLVSRSEQRAVNPSLICSGESVKIVWKGEDDMKVGHRKKFLCPGVDPLLLVETLTLGTVPIAAGVVDPKIAFAGIAAVEVPAEAGSPAQLNGAHGSALLWCHGPVLAVELSVVAEDVRDFESRVTHGDSDLESIQGTLDVGAFRDGLEVDHRGLNAGMSQKFLDVPEAGACFE